jgi:hypothetical protein
MDEKPKMFDPEEMARRVEKLKKEGRMPSFEAFEQAMGLIRDEWQKELLLLNGEPVPPGPKVN